MKDEEINDPGSKDDNLRLSSEVPNFAVVLESQGECILFKFFHLGMRLIVWFK